MNIENALGLSASWSATLVGIGFDLFVKSAALLTLALIAQSILGRRRAALGSAIGNACLVGVLLLPISIWLAPSWKVAVLSSESVVIQPKSSNPASTSTAIPAASGDRIERFETSPPPFDSSVVDKTPIAPKTDVARLAPIATSRATIVPAPPSRPIDWYAVGVAVYFAGAVVLLVRLLVSLIGAARLRASCALVEDEEWRVALERCRKRLRTKGDVLLARSARVCSPIILGWSRPIVVLPNEPSALNPREHADAVLLHELAHAVRGDYAWNVLLRLVQAVYWPQPLVWRLGRAIAEFRERACDDLCVYELGGPSAYRDTLLAVAVGLSSRSRAEIGLAMARTSKLARRLARIDQSRGDARCLPGFPARLTIAVTFVALSSLFGAIRLTRAEPRQTTPATQATKSVDPPKEIKKTPTPKPENIKGRVFHLQVVAAETGKPAANATVRVWIALGEYYGKTDAQGRFDIVHSTGPADHSFGVDVWGDGLAMRRFHWGDDPNAPIPDGDVVRLEPGETLGGMIKDEQGRPVEGAEILLWSHNYRKKAPDELLFDLRAFSGPDGRWKTSGAPETTGELLGIRINHPDFISDRMYSRKEIPKIADLRALKAESILKKGVPIEGRVLDADGKPVAGARVLPDEQQDYFNAVKYAATTDADGRFRTVQFGAGDQLLIATAKGRGPGILRVKVDKAVQQVEIRLGKPRVFKARVVDPAGKPIEGAYINVMSWRGSSCLGAFLYSDADGFARWDDAPEDSFMIFVLHDGYRAIQMQQIGPNDRDMVFTLRPALIIRGKVVDAATNKGVKRALIEFAPINPKTGAATKWSALPENDLGVFNGRFSVSLPVGEVEAYKLRIVAEGYAPLISRAFRRDEKVVANYDVKLGPFKLDDGPFATVVHPDGAPLAKARVWFGLHPHEGLTIETDRVRNDFKVLTDANGRFALPARETPWIALILGDDSFAFVRKDDLAASSKIMAKPYARVEGRYMIGVNPGAKLPVRLSGIFQDRSTMQHPIFTERETTTDGDGRFAFEKVVPLGLLRVGRFDPAGVPGRLWTLGEAVQVAPGETTRVAFGGKGRAIVGRVAPPDGWIKPIDFTDQGQLLLVSVKPGWPMPLHLFRGKTDIKESGWFDWLEEHRNTPESREYYAKFHRVYVDLAPDGSFRIDDVPEGTYRLTILLPDAELSRQRSSGSFNRLSRQFTIPSIPGGRSDKALDLGVLRLQPRVALNVGELAPKVEATTVDGKKLVLPEDFRGKFLLLDFGAMWNDQSYFQIVRLNDVWKRFGGDPRFAILSLVSAPDDAETRAFVAGKGEPWPQTIIGPLSNPIADAYGIDDENIYSAILIGPDGKVIAKDLYSNKIGEAVGKALGKGEK